MHSVSTQLPYSSTGFFSTIVLDYLNEKEELQPFYADPATLDGIKSAIIARKQFKTNRQLLTGVLRQQYSGVALSSRQSLFLEQLEDENTFTVCTAHQPNIFTGHLYFIYKILHAVKLAEWLSNNIPGCSFVPVYYMGSEDADLDELGHIFLDGEKYEWKTDQKGAVGRMKVDKELINLITAFSGQLLVHPHGSAIVDLMLQCYQPGTTIEQATFKLVNQLFAQYGLLVLLPDNKLLKQAFAPVMERELLEQFSHKAVTETVAAFPSKYKVQAGGRELNLFYLTAHARERIESVNGAWSIVNEEKVFSKDTILNELKEFPERFSPNVILRPVYQEMILPNIAFIGGGGEIAYWLELKKVFEAAGVPYPVQVLRNSFLLIDGKSDQVMTKLKLTVEDIFQPELTLMNNIVKRESVRQLSLDKEKNAITSLYDQLKTIAANTDVTLKGHVEALHKKTLQKIDTLEKKMLRAEKRKFAAQQHQLHQLKAKLFPNNSLQERVENFMLHYAKYGQQFIENIYENSLALEQEFMVLANPVMATTGDAV